MLERKLGFSLLQITIKCSMFRFTSQNDKNPFHIIHTKTILMVRNLH